MPTIRYIEHHFSRAARSVIDGANAIIEEYESQGFQLTLRQLYYQFVSRGWLPNKQSEYKRLGSIINDGRLDGQIDWNAIEDRGRHVVRLATWTEPSEIVADAADQFRINPWITQAYYVEVWIEKEALSGVIGPVCTELRVPYFACKGYCSQSEMWGAAHTRLLPWAGVGKVPVILHLGDHDPSGIDMTRDIEERLSLFVQAPVRVERLALNRSQVDRYHPPPNPAKMTDSRIGAYLARHGESSWELDALKPEILASLIRRRVNGLLDKAKWRIELDREKGMKATLAAISERYEDVCKFLAGRRGRRKK